MRPQGGSFLSVKLLTAVEPLGCLSRERFLGAVQEVEIVWLNISFALDRKP